MLTCSSCKRDTGVSEENPKLERMLLFRRYILEDYKMCGQLNRLVYTMGKKIEDCLIGGAQGEIKCFQH